MLNKCFMKRLLLLVQTFKGSGCEYVSYLVLLNELACAFCFQ